MGTRSTAGSLTFSSHISVFTKTVGQGKHKILTVISLHSFRFTSRISPVVP